MASSTSPIKTVVVLVQENRSFDHILGWMKSLNPEIDGVTGSESNPLSTSDPNSDRIHFTDDAAFVESDPGHSFQAIYEQVFGTPWTEASAASKLPPAMEGFAQQAEVIEKGLSATVMSGYRPEAVPVYKELVTEFSVCDRWFASLPTSTQANRLYVHSATSHGATSNDTKKLVEGFPQKTIFDSLDESGFSFGIYYQNPPTTLFYRNLRKLKYVKNFHPFDVSFRRHCKEGKLPNYVVIEQRYFDSKLLPANDDHPSHDIYEGQKLVKEIYEALRGSPQWEEVLFLIVYDEHGGFYDHVPTPVEGVPSPDDIQGPEPFKFHFDRLGVRVPAIVVSPWINPGTVLHGPSGPQPSSQFEHSSIAATVKKIFNLKEFLTKRDAWAGTFDVVLNRQTPRTDCPVTLSNPVKLRGMEANETKQVSEFQGELVQMAAALNGDHKEDAYPHKLVENLKVSEAITYVEGALKKFWDDFDHSMTNTSRIDGSDTGASTNTQSPLTPKTFVQKIFSCLICNN